MNCGYLYLSGPGEQGSKYSKQFPVAFVHDFNFDISVFSDLYVVTEIKTNTIYSLTNQFNISYMRMFLCYLFYSEITGLRIWSFDVSSIIPSIIDDRGLFH